MGFHESYSKSAVGKKWSYTSSFHYDLTPTEKLLKYSNFIFAFAIILFGISLGVIAVYIFEESQNYILFIGDKNLTGLKLLMGAGGTLVVLGALGLLTTVRLNRKLMLFYVSMTFTAIIVQGAGVGIAIEQIDTLKDDVNRTFYEMIENYADYNFEENSTVPLDYMQSTLKCCGLYSGYGDWNATSKLAIEWIKLHSIDTPDSCCIEGKIKIRCGFGQAKPLENEEDRVVYKKGCINTFYQWIDGKVSSVTIITIANLVCQLTSATFLFLLRQSMHIITF
ncbi:hypothetical protein ACHWQZ_G002061 [Mnemiopsis leidyi]